MLKGPDLSKWQGTIDFTKLKNEVDFVILRSSYGLNTKDTKFYEYAAACKRLGIPILGVYHFCYASSLLEAEKEALNCIDAVQKAGLDKSTILFYDLEYDSVTTAAKKGVTINKNACSQYTAAFCNVAHSMGYRTGLYFNKDYYRNMYDFSVIPSFCVRWLAEYNKSPSYDCSIQQVSSTYKVSGVGGSVDWNYLWDEKLLEKEEDTMTDNEFYDRFADAMEEYRIRLRMKEPNPWSQDARDFCIKNGIFKGDGKGNIQWEDFLTREQAAQLIYNALKDKTN